MRRSLPAAKSVIAAALAAVLAVGLSSPAQAQMPAQLPFIDDVSPGAPLPIDGTWRIREINELIVIRGGYAYAVDGWVHALVFRIMPGQVIMTNLRATPDGSFIGDNLPLMAKFVLSPLPDGSLLGRTQALIPAIYTFDPASAPGGSPWDDAPQVPPGEPGGSPWGDAPQVPPDEPGAPPDDWVSPW